MKYTKVIFKRVNFKFQRQLQFTFAVVLGLSSLFYTPVSAQTFDVGGGPRGIAFDGEHIWVVNGNEDSVSKLRSADGTHLGSFAVGDSPVDIVFDGLNIWVSNSGSNTVTKLRVTDGEILGTYPCGSQPRGLIFDGSSIWVANYFSDHVTQLRASDGMNLGDHPIPGTSAWAIGFDGTSIWLVDDNFGEVVKFRPSDGQILGAYPVGPSPSGIVYDGANIWVGNDNGELVKIRASDGLNLGVFPAFPNSSTPGDLAYDGTHIWATNSSNDSVAVIRASDGSWVNSIKTGHRPNGIVFDGASMWVANHFSDDVNRFDRSWLSEVLIISDRLWISNDLLESGWNQLGLVGIDWERARAPYPVSIPATNIIPDTSASFIWHDPQHNSNGSTGPVEAFFRREFVLDLTKGGIVSAVAKIHADDDCEFFVNGQQVLLDDSGSASGIADVVDLEPWLHDGVNLFAIHAVDGSWNDPRNLLGESLLFEARIQLTQFGTSFRRGDCNADGMVDVTDPITNLAYQFLGTFNPSCLDACDFDDSGLIDVTDAIGNLTHLFLGGFPPAFPGKDTCGLDPFDDEVSCESFAPCEATP